jgi:signal transduction histidine kinase
MGIFVIAKDWKKDINRLFLFLTLSTATFGVVFIAASFAQTQEWAYRIWSLNVLNVFLTMSVVHFMLRAAERHIRYRWYIGLTYGVGFLILIASVLFPRLFLVDVSPKLYLPYYLDGGPLYSAMLVYFFLFPILPFLELLRGYLKSAGRGRRRFEYFLLMMVIGYSLGSLNFFLVYDIPVDPVFGMLFGLYLVPLAYGIVSDQLLDIRLVIKRALVYSIGIALLAGLLTALILLNNILVSHIPWLQFWTIPLLVAIAAFVFGRIAWLQIGEADRVKYEFITVATHKLRTPLTHIRWESLGLLNSTTDVETKKKIERIVESNNRLIELTNILLEVAQMDGSAHLYQEERVDISALARSVLERFAPTIERKKLLIRKHIPEESLIVLGDTKRLESVIEVFLNNSVTYTPDGGKVEVSLTSEKGKVLFRVVDSGIGVSKEDKDQVFTKFFRTEGAKHIDTEGVGVGLAVAKNIIEAHHGSIGVDSEGVGKGSTFWFTLPR